MVQLGACAFTFSGRGKRATRGTVVLQRFAKKVEPGIKGISHSSFSPVTRLHCVRKPFSICRDARSSVSIFICGYSNLNFVRSSASTLFRLGGAFHTYRNE